MKVSNLFHPYYKSHILEYTTWRLAYEGGRPFINSYLQKFDIREDNDDFAKRKELTYLPAFAKRGLNKVRNSLYQRFSEISRKGGSNTYKEAIEGKGGGVDLEGMDMNTFVGQKILPELLPMQRVGVFVDMPTFDSTSTLANYKQPPRPYLYYYCTEDIANWSIAFYNNELYYTHLLLREYDIEYDQITGMPISTYECFRYFQLTDNGVVVQKYKPVKENYKKDDVLLEEYVLDLPRIPFVLFDIGQSLIEDICDYQIGLLNLSSSDLHYAMKSNFPLFTMQYDPRTEDIFKRQGPITVTTENADGTQEAQEIANETSEKPKEIRIGTLHGLKYAKDMERPSWVHPSSEPLKWSMEKQKQMKEEMQQLLDLALTAITKEDDNGNIESGLAAIGLELQRGEREIAKIWELYQNNKNDPATVTYPTTYSLKSDEQRITEAEKQNDLKVVVPSKTYQKHVAKNIANTLFEGKVSSEKLEKMHQEIEAANYITSEAEEIKADMEMGLVTAETASNARGYDGAKEVPLAQKEHADRLARLAISQTEGAAAARGISSDPTDTSAKDEKKLSQNTSDLKVLPGQKLTRGKNGKIP